MDIIQQKIDRLLSPRSVINWTSINFPRSDDTEEAIWKIANLLNLPSLNSIYARCSRLAYRQSTIEEEMEKIRRSKSSYIQTMGSEILPAFQDFLSTRQIDAIPDLHEFTDYIHIYIGDDIPDFPIRIRPSFIAIEDGKLTPYFLIGWSDLSLSPYQKQLLSTVICNSILTHQDFIGSDAMIVVMPRMEYSNDRDVRWWKARSYASLTDDQFADQASRFQRGLVNTIHRLRRS